MKRAFSTEDGRYGVAWCEGQAYRVVLGGKFETRLEAETWFAEKLGGPVAWGDRDAREWARAHVRAGRFERIG